MRGFFLGRWQIEATLKMDPSGISSFWKGLYTEFSCQMIWVWQSSLFMMVFYLDFKWLLPEFTTIKEVYMLKNNPNACKEGCSHLYTVIRKQDLP